MFRGASRLACDLDISVEAGYSVRKEIGIPAMSTFYGILIRIYDSDHAPPHFHAGHPNWFSIGLSFIERNSAKTGDWHKQTVHPTTDRKSVV